MVVAPTKVTAVPRVLPAVVVIGSVSLVAGYIRSQLKTQSNSMDRFFSQYNSPASEASRSKTYEGVKDPRRSLFNVLGW